MTRTHRDHPNANPKGCPHCVELAAKNFHNPGLHKLPSGIKYLLKPTNFVFNQTNQKDSIIVAMPTDCYPGAEDWKKRFDIKGDFEKFSLHALPKAMKSFTKPTDLVFKEQDLKDIDIVVMTEKQVADWKLWLVEIGYFDNLNEQRALKKKNAKADNGKPCLQWEKEKGKYKNKTELMALNYF
jgi:hypothetical protein